MSAPPELIRVVRLWVEKAEEDLTNAEHTLKLREGCPLATVCFHAQQCVEKYFKALLTLRAVPFSKTHDLLELLSQVPANAGLKLQAADVSVVNRYSVEARYPGEWEPIGRQEAEKAAVLARKIREMIRPLLPKEAVE